MDNFQIDSVLGDASRAVGEKWGEKCHRCENAVRQSPLLAVAGAAGAGYVLQLLPLTRIFGTLVKLIFALVKPALIIYGAAKLVEHVRASCRCENNNGAPEDSLERLTEVVPFAGDSVTFGSSAGNR